MHVQTPYYNLKYLSTSNAPKAKGVLDYLFKIFKLALFYINNFNTSRSCKVAEWKAI